MPLYEFDCLECGNSFETLVPRVVDISKVKCPACESRNLEEKISTFASPSRGGVSGASNCAPSGG